MYHRYDRELKYRPHGFCPAAIWSAMQQPAVASTEDFTTRSAYCLLEHIHHVNNDLVYVLRYLKQLKRWRNNFCMYMQTHLDYNSIIFICIFILISFWNVMYSCTNLMLVKDIRYPSLKLNIAIQLWSLQ